MNTDRVRSIHIFRFFSSGSDVKTSIFIRGCRVDTPTGEEIHVYIVDNKEGMSIENLHFDSIFTILK